MPRQDDEEHYTCWVCGDDIEPPGADEAENPYHVEDVLWRTCNACAEKAR